MGHTMFTGRAKEKEAVDYITDEANVSAARIDLEVIAKGDENTLYVMQLIYADGTESDRLRFSAPNDININDVSDKYLKDFYIDEFLAKKENARNSENAVPVFMPIPLMIG